MPTLCNMGKLDLVSEGYGFVGPIKRLFHGTLAESQWISQLEQLVALV